MTDRSTPLIPARPNNAQANTDEPQAQAWGHSPSNRRALTLTETLLLLVIAFMGLFTALWITDSFEDRLLEHENQRILASLSTALHDYEQHTASTPPGPVSKASAALLELPQARANLHDLPLLRTADGYATLLDAYLRPLAYTETSQGSLPVGDFVSAGPDGLFGDAFADDPALTDALIDDRYSSDFESLF